MVGRKKLPKSKKQDKPIQIVISSTFRKGLEAATEAAGDPTFSEFIKRAIIERAAKHDVTIKR